MLNDRCQIRFIPLDLVRDTKAVAADGVEITAVELIRWRERDRVNQNVEAVPALGEPLEERVDLRVVGDVERQRQVAAEVGRHALDAGFQLVVLVAERELGAFAAHGLRNAPGDRAVAREADDDGPLSCEESHQPDCSVTSTTIFKRCPGCRYLSAAPEFHSTSWLTETLKRRAIDDSESPRRTT